MKDLERIATLAALSGVDPSEAMPDKLRLAVKSAGRALVSESISAPKADVVPATRYRAARSARRWPGWPAWPLPSWR